MLSRKAMLAGVAASMLVPRLAQADTAGVAREAALTAALLRPNSLAYYAAKANMLFGNMIGRDFLNDPDYVRAVRQECSLVCVPLMGPAVTRRSPNKFDFGSVDPQVAFANENKLAMYGGYLVAHDAVPAWITPATDRETALAEMKRIITTTMTRFSGQLDYWIVVNEAIAPQGLRNSAWLSTLGPDYIELAFRTAREADPHAVLVLNENNIETDAENAYKKRAAMLQLLRSLAQKGVPINGVGMQGHLPADRKIDVPALDAFVNSVHELGLKIMVTELDVFDAALPADVNARDAGVAQLCTEFLKALLQHPIVESVSSWGLSDSHSWYNNKSNPPALRRQDDLLSRGSLLDETFGRKPVYVGVERVFGSSPRFSG
jgi:endo-1,4-beta-xylanase